MKSIRRYLYRSLSVVLVTVLAITIVTAFMVTDHELEEILDAELSMQARIIAGLMPATASHEDYAAIARHLGQPGQPAAVFPAGQSQQVGVWAQLFHHEERKLMVGFWNADGSPRLLAPLWHSAEQSFPAPTREGYRWVDYDGKRWRVFSLQSPEQGFWLSLGLLDSFHRQISKRVTWGNMLTLLAALPVLLFLMSRAVRHGLAPIAELSNAVESRHSGHLSELDTRTPLELDNLRQAINNFIGRLRKSLESERRFTANAAHELRTPLAALTIHLENARAGGADSLAKAETGIKRLQRVVDQLLFLARLDSGSSGIMTPVDLYAVVSEIAAELWSLAEADGKQIELSGDRQVWISADATELGILCRNLIDNALRYTPPGGLVEVIVTAASDGAHLTVRDNGPGIAPELIGKMTERFRRGASQQTTGSGLGLAIVVELAQRQAAKLTLANRDPHGFEVVLHWPTAGN